MVTLRASRPYFIRCIRSNDEQREMEFDDRLVREQLVSSGMVETVRIKPGLDKFFFRFFFSWNFRKTQKLEISENWKFLKNSKFWRKIFCKNLFLAEPWIKQSSYPIRIEHGEFCRTYRPLLTNATAFSSVIDQLHHLLHSQLDLTESAFRLGKSKIFLRDHARLLLDQRLESTIIGKVKLLQRNVRAWLRRKGAGMGMTKVIKSKVTRHFLLSFSLKYKL